jgi:hypothetical protein
MARSVGICRRAQGPTGAAPSCRRTGRGCSGSCQWRLASCAGSCPRRASKASYRSRTASLRPKVDIGGTRSDTRVRAPDARPPRTVPGLRVQVSKVSRPDRRRRSPQGRSERTAAGSPRGAASFNARNRTRVNIVLGTGTLSELDAEDFAQGSGALAAQVADGPDLLLVTLMNLGGGNVLTYDTKGLTGIPYRNQSFGFVYDVFYTVPRAEARAPAIQATTQGGGVAGITAGEFGRDIPNQRYP